MSGTPDKKMIPSRESLRAAEARERHRRAVEDRVHARKHGILRVVMLVFLVLCVVGLIVDFSRVLSKQEERHTLWGRVRRLAGAAPKGTAADIEAHLGKGARYQDPDGFFSVEAPYGWWRRPKAQSGFYNVVFAGPSEKDMSIHVVYKPGETFEGLWAQLKAIEGKLEARTHMDVIFVGSQRMIKRTARLWRNKVLLLDFVTGDLVHHVQFSANPNEYDQYEPVFLKIMETYQPGQVLNIPPPPEQTFSIGLQ